MSPIPVPNRDYLAFPTTRPVFEFRPEPVDLFWACARVPAKTSAQELVLLFTFQAEAEGLFFELGKFPCGFHSFGKSFGKGGTLAFGNARPVQAGDGVPADVSLRIKRPIGRDVNHRAVGRDVDGKFQQEWVVVLHSVEIPAQAECVERGTKNILLTAQVH